MAEYGFIIRNIGYFTSGNEPDGIGNATHNTFAKLTWIFVFLVAVQFREF
jgi:hypothetical protein